MSAAFSLDPKGQRIPAQGATLGMGWRVSVRDTDGGYRSGTQMAGIDPGHRWCVWMRSEGAAHRSGAASVGRRIVRARVSPRVGDATGLIVP